MYVYVTSGTRLREMYAKMFSYFALKNVMEKRIIELKMTYPSLWVLILHI